MIPRGLQGAGLGPGRVLRLVSVGWRFQLLTLTRSGFSNMTSIVQPLIFATLAFYLFKAGNRPGTLLYAALGAGLMGIWSTTCVLSSRGVPSATSRPFAITTSRSQSVSASNM